MVKIKRFFLFFLLASLAISQALAENPEDFLVEDGTPAPLVPVYERAAQTEFSFPGVFLKEGSSPKQTETSYTSANLSLTITSFRYEKTDVYVAEIYLRTLDCFRRDVGNGFKNGYLSVKSHAARDGSAVLAITGDSSAKFIAGYVVGNGEIWRETHNNKRDIGVIGWDGMLRCYTPAEMEAAGLGETPPDCWQCFLFGPSLLDGEGKAKTTFTTTNVAAANPRAALGCFEPGHYCLVLVDGRSTRSALEEGGRNGGLTLIQLSCLMEKLGCVSAYNLDGGKSAVMVYFGEFVNTPINRGRQIGDAIIIGEPLMQEEE